MLKLFIVCGGRDYANSERVGRVLRLLWNKFPHAEMYEGGAKGADELARLWAASQKVTFYTFHADWKTYGTSAGMLRNRQMLREAMGRFPPDQIGLVAFPGGAGTADMTRIAKAAQVNIIEVTPTRIKLDWELTPFAELTKVGASQ